MNKLFPGPAEMQREGYILANRPAAACAGGFPASASAHAANPSAARNAHPAVQPVTVPQDQIEAALLGLLAQRGPDKSICPSEAARALDADWRPLLGAVRRAAISLAERGRIQILRKGRAVAPQDARGVIRLRQMPEQGEH